MASVTSEEVAVYWPLCERLAHRFGKRDYRIEHDDLVQEGAIKVWQLLEKGVLPTATTIMPALKDYARRVTAGVSTEPVGLLIETALSS